LGVFTQADWVLLQVSTVQATLSLQFGAVPPTQPVPGAPFGGLQVSTPLQYCPSLQLLFCGTCTQLSLVRSQKSAVHV
jgi:hypothetical protein